MPAASAPSFEVPDLTSHEEAVHCEQWLLRGLVQGVGFRPFVWQLARRLGIQGQIRNTGEGVEILAQGQPARLAAFERALHEERPPLAEFELTARQSLPADPALGLALGSHRPISTLESLGFAMMHSETLREAILVGCQYQKISGR